MSWKIVSLSMLVCAVAVLDGCADAYAPAEGEPYGVIGARTVAQEQQMQRFANSQARWNGSIQGLPQGQGKAASTQSYRQPQPASRPGVIGLQQYSNPRQYTPQPVNPSPSARAPAGVTYGAPPAAAAPAAPVNPYMPTAPQDATLKQEVQILSARIERLERMMTSPAAAAVAPTPLPAPKPTLNIYQVAPDGRTAWVSTGVVKGIAQGQTYQVTRGGAVIGQVQIARVWPGVCELTVMWSQGPLQRGDVATQIDAPTPPPM